MATPNYSNYNMIELLECLDKIDKEKWPERHQAIVQCIDNKNMTDSHSKSVHDSALFSDYCAGLQSELHDSFEVDFISFLKPFISKLKNKYPSVLESAQCPLCSNKLTVNQAFLHWKVSCKNCEQSFKVYQTGSA